MAPITRCIGWRSWIDTASYIPSAPPPPQPPPPQCHDRVDRADEFDATHSGFFINSSLALVLRFQRIFVSVCNVLKGIKLHGFSEARIAALW